MPHWTDDGTPHEHLVITYVHPDHERWNLLFEPHLHWIEECVADGSIVASRSLPDEKPLSALIIMEARDLAHVNQLLAKDPFIVEGLVTSLSVQRWQPLFGVLAANAG